MSIVTLDSAFLQYGEDILLNNINLSIEPNERVCIVGRNGTGKSTLMKVIAKMVQLDSGILNIQDGITVARLQQQPPLAHKMTAYEYLVSGLGETAQILNDYHQVNYELAHNYSDALLGKLNSLTNQIETKGLWNLHNEVERVAQTLNLDLEASIDSFSGGWLRKLELAKCLVVKPDLMLLDEPTNHLDIKSIEWLEEQLLNYKGTIVFISHDRKFTDKIATRILEIDRGNLYSHPGNFEKFLANQQARFEVEEKQVSEFKKFLSEEEKWIRKGIEARRTRNEGRVRRLKSLREENERLRSLNKFKELAVSAAASGKLVCTVENLEFGYGDKTLFSDFSEWVISGSKIAIVGENGAGKTTLVKLLLGELEPTHGVVHQVANIKLGYFDQHRIALDLEQTALENVFDQKDEQMVNGVMRHGIGYLGDYLFTSDKARSKVSSLSGGERNRLLLAKLMAKESNLLVLDEPTNDLDVETLELLEELVSKYTGTVILVSHDRTFIDQVVDQVWFVEAGKVWKYVGGYSDNIERHRQAVAKYLVTLNKPVLTNTFSEEATKTVKVVNRKEKLTYREAKDLEELPDRIEKMDQEIEELKELLNQAYSNNANYLEIQELTQKLDALNTQQEEAFLRWEELQLKKEMLDSQ